MHVVGHWLSQLPQLPGSLSVSTHPTSQQAGVVKPSSVQSLPQMPQLLMSTAASEQLLLQHCGSLPPHPLSHCPQLLGSEVVSTQLPSHAVRLSPQLVAHAPFMHVPVPQELPQPPQFNGSLSRSVQVPPQHPGFVPLKHEAPQDPQLSKSCEPSEQLLLQQSGRSPPQPLPQPPQLLASLVVATHAPSQAVGKGSVQVIAPVHWPFVHAAPPQSLSHAPQFCESLSVSVQPPSQQLGEVPIVQVVLQLPQLLMSLAMSVQPVSPQHPGVVNPSTVQSFPQPPQLLTSVVVSEHDDEQQLWVPVHALPHVPQFFASDEVSSHIPAQQPATRRLSIIVQSAPPPDEHPPQLLTSVFVSVHTPSHCVSPAEQLEPHLPAAQTWPVGHAVPHFPQFRLSV